MTTKFDYATSVLRNAGYIASETQEKIRNARILFAGCGLGAAVAIAATRMGFSNFVLVDGDTVDAHNLNRQFYDFDDIGSPKVEALQKHIQRINPEANVRAVYANLDKSNVDELIGSVDIVFDTIDFLDLEAILGLHVTAKELKKPVFTALSAGPGSAVLYCPANSNNSLADIIHRDVLKAQAEGDAGYTSVFGNIMARIGAGFDPRVMEQVAKALTIMEDGRPCPASQIAAGSFGVAAHAVTMMHDMLAGLEVPESPNMVVHNYQTGTTKLVDIGG